MLFLAGDIGGTKTALALYELRREKLSPLKKDIFPSKDFNSLEAIIHAFISDEKIERACFGIAGAIENQICKATNLPWIIKAQEISSRFQIEHVVLINDLEANGYGIKTLTDKDFYVINKGNPQYDGNQALISAGTGLGESPLFFHRNQIIPSTSEGGHADFAPRSGTEVELLFYLQELFGHVSYERVLSGAGLVNLYNFLIHKNYYLESKIVQETMQKNDPGKVISQFAIAKKCPACVHALDWFCSIYGAEAGNFALKVLAIGGVFLGGGIAPKIKDVLVKSSFFSSFINKGRFSELLSQVPVKIILDQETALKGSAYYCQHEING